MRNQSNRLARLERISNPPDAHATNALLWVLDRGLLPCAVAFTEQGKPDKVREVVVVANTAAGHQLTPAQVEWAVRRLANNVASYKADVVAIAQRRANEAAARERQLRADAAFLARNRRLCGWQEGPQTDEEAIYQESVRFWEQREGRG